MRALLAGLLLSYVTLAGCGGEVALPRTAAAPPAAAIPADELDRELPIDHRATKGRLENGLTYYILPNRAPAQRAQIWLAVNAGSVLEDDDQRGLAHLVEHMAFNGTKRFPKQDLVDFIER